LATAGEREEAILDATGALLAEGSSFASLKVEHIARRAGLGRTNFYFYFYFSDKQQLLKRLPKEAVPARAAGRWALWRAHSSSHGDLAALGVRNRRHRKTR